ncbi:PqiB family protein [Volucribacter amazonae]|uniref:Mce/MlaD domain-containing protein n=1 Tax=Volucribacter amazonae TaxID=256731 RepID=A0A9X4P848_9PAST|nr:PqiB family protein [Volucribacter amazonae]MDG6894273.1 hypothetical protein [Volucribacter amazonae]
MTSHHNHTKKNDSQTYQNAYIRQIKRISPFWLLPVIALFIGATLFFQIIKEQGTSITIIFNNGDGLVAGKTQVRYQGLQIGEVKKVNFADDLKHVEVTANIYPEARSILRENTKFWIVQPSASLAGISGLDTLVSGNYITLQPGDGEPAEHFIAENEGPIAEVHQGDLLIHLISDDLGSISAGASVYFKKMPVGKIYDYRLTDDQQKVEIDVVIEKNYANLVKKDSRFWNISGIQADVSLAGLSVNIDSLNAVVQGAVSFDSPQESPVAQANEIYTLYPNLQAAKRGISVKVKLPNITGLEPNKTLVFYQNMPVGLLSELKINEQEQDQNIIQGTLLIDPNMGNLLRQSTEIVLRDKKMGLADLTNLEELFKGRSFEILPGEGKARYDFEVIKQSELLLKRPNTLLLTLTSPESYGVDEGQPVYYHDITIGEVIKRQSDIEQVKFTIAIAAEYRHLIGKDSKFIAGSNFDLSLGLDGVKIEAATPSKWLEGGIRLVKGQASEDTVLTHYPLYKNQSYADMGMTGNRLTPTISLTTTSLPNINPDSLVLYRQYEVGKILDIRPMAKNFEVDVLIYPKYRHLLTKQSRFWVESPTQVDITPKGISVQASPLGRALKGAISFDNMGQPQASNKTLYANALSARSAGQEITLITDNASNLGKGMSLKYMGLTIGEISQVNFNQKSKRIVAKALIQPEYLDIVARENSKFKIISPQISAGGIENLDSLLQPYIDVEAGTGVRKMEFKLSQITPTASKYNNGFPLILEASNAMNLTTGAPILYRGVEVGMIQNIEINKQGDRVLIHILIGNKHRYLVRQNSEFWLASGYNFELGWSGAEFNTGSIQQLLKGGISFSTPSGTVVQPEAKANQRFLLRQQRPEDARQWNQAVMP